MTHNIVEELSEDLRERAARATIHRLQRLEPTGIRGDLDARNLWDEICLIARTLVQGDDLYDAAESTMSSLVEAWLEKRKPFEKAALRLDSEEDIVEYILHRVWAKASNWENARLRRYEGEE